MSTLTSNYTYSVIILYSAFTTSCTITKRTREINSSLRWHILHTNALVYSPNKCTCIFSKQMHLHILQTPNKCTCIFSKLQTSALAYSPNSKQVHLHILQTPNKCTCIFSKLQTSALAYSPNKCTCIFFKLQTSALACFWPQLRQHCSEVNQSSKT